MAVRRSVVLFTAIFPPGIVRSPVTDRFGTGAQCAHGIEHVVTMPPVQRLQGIRGGLGSQQAIEGATVLLTTTGGNQITPLATVILLVTGTGLQPAVQFPGLPRTLHFRSGLRTERGAIGVVKEVRTAEAVGNTRVGGWLAYRDFQLVITEGHEVAVGERDAAAFADRIR